MQAEGDQNDRPSSESYSEELFSINFNPSDFVISDIEAVPILESLDITPNVEDLHSAVVHDLVPYGNMSSNFDSTSGQGVTSTSENVNSAIMAIPQPTFASLTRPELVHLRQIPVKCTDWTGEHNFTVAIQPPERRLKAFNWTYSHSRDKLYVKKGELCPLSFASNNNVPATTKIRALPVFTDITQCTEIVHRCYEHCMLDSSKGLLFSDHLIHCSGSGASYEEDCAGRRSVVVPFITTPSGQDVLTYLFKFLCFGSCSGGLNRRPIRVIFTLEHNNQIIGRRSIEVKICACPVRDCKIDDEQETQTTSEPKRLKRKPIELPSLQTSSKRQRIQEPGQRPRFTIECKSSAEYSFLSHCQLLYRLYKRFKTINPEAVKYLRQALNMKKERE